MISKVTFRTLLEFQIIQMTTDCRQKWRAKCNHVRNGGLLTNPPPTTMIMPESSTTSSVRTTSAATIVNSEENLPKNRSISVKTPRDNFLAIGFLWGLCVPGAGLLALGTIFFAIWTLLCCIFTGRFTRTTDMSRQAGCNCYGLGMCLIGFSSKYETSFVAIAHSITRGGVAPIATEYHVMDSVEGSSSDEPVVSTVSSDVLWRC